MIGQDYKQRIEEIRRGEVPDGYTHTRVGVIPMDWQETRVIDRFDRVTRKNDENNKNVLTISAQQGLISQGDYYEKEIASEDKSTYYLLRKGDFAYNKSYSSGYPYGAIKRLEAFEKGIVSPLYICFAPKKETDSDFYRFYFDSGLFNREIYRIAQEGARNHGLLNVATEDFFGATLIDLPKDEQKKIAQILDACDRVIELKQKLVDELKKLKKACLAKMFPQDGKTVPEIRFPGFTAPWGQQKLSAYLYVSTEKNIEDTYTKQDVLSVSGDHGIVNQIEFQGRSFAGASVFNYGVVYTGDIVYTKSPLKLNPYGIIKTNKGKPGIVSTLYAIYHPRGNVDSSFVQTYFEQHARMNNYMRPLVNKGAKNDMKVSPENALKGLVFFPRIDEQQMIVSMFNHLDSYITLYQCELETEQKREKALMQLLLTGIVRV